MKEVEIKLQLSALAAETIVASGVLHGVPVQRALSAIYYDTDDRMLASGRMSLRIRATDGRRVQTFKTPDPGGAFALLVRNEWEREVALDCIAPDGPIRDALGDRIAALAPVFRVEVSRQIWSITHEGALIEAALDRGNVLAEGRLAPVCELELELKSGSHHALFDLSRKLAEVAPVRLGIMTKSERGYRLIAALPQALGAEPVAIDADQSSAEAFQSIAQACIRHFRLNEDLLFPARSSDALHQARVALRRLRSALSIFGSLFGEEEGADLSRRLRDLALKLGKVRDLDVLVSTTPPGALYERLSSLRATAYDRLEGELDASDTRTLMFEVMEWVVDGHWLSDPATEGARNAPIGDFAAAALGRLRRKVRQSGRNLAQLDDEARHHARKQAKKLRYALDFFLPLYKRRTKGFLSALKRLQDDLGTLNDMATAARTLRELGVEDDPDARQPMSRGRRKKLLAEAETALGDLLEAKRFWK